MTKPTTLIVIRETLAQSLLRDAGSVASSFALILPGFYIGSTALQFIGGLLLVLFAFCKLTTIVNDNRMTLEQARDKIDAWLKAGE
jgi:hypothetical protein